VRGQDAEEGAGGLEALAEQLTEAVAELTTSTAWVAMLRVAARFTRYSPTNRLLLWMQAEQRGVTLSRVAGYRVRTTPTHSPRRPTDGSGVADRSSQPADQEDQASRTRIPQL
jgi:hypothetical protein